MKIVQFEVKVKSDNNTCQKIAGVYQKRTSTKFRSKLTIKIVNNNRNRAVFERLNGPNG
jgi:hypothetical protein